MLFTRGRFAEHERTYMELTINEKILVYSVHNIIEIDPNFDIHEFAHFIYTLASAHGAEADFLSVIGSWGDTLEDEEVAEMLKDGDYYFNPAMGYLTTKEKVFYRSGCTQEENQETPCPAQEGS